MPNVTTYYVNSDKVFVFPSTRRSDKLPTSRYLQEQSFSNIVRMMCDYNDGSFIYTKPSVAEVTTTDATVVNRVFKFILDDPFELYMHGYWFKFSKLQTILTACNIDASSTALQIYAYIDLDKCCISATGTAELEKEYIYELKGQDIFEQDNPNEKYQGIKFTIDPPEEAANRYIFKILERPNTTTSWEYAVIQSTLYRYSSLAMDFNVDGGEIL